MKDLELGFLRLNRLDFARDNPFAGLIFFHHKPPDPGEEASGAFHAFHAPRFHLLERSHKHLVTTESIRAVELDHVEGIDDVAPAL